MSSGSKRPDSDPIRVVNYDAVRELAELFASPDLFGSREAFIERHSRAACPSGLDFDEDGCFRTFGCERPFGHAGPHAAEFDRAESHEKHKHPMVVWL